MSNKIVVVGATGMLGEPVARRLQKHDFFVRVFTHSEETACQKFGAEFEIMNGNVEDIASLERALSGCSGVHINLYGSNDPDLERRGVENVVKAASNSTVKRITYLSGATVCEENTWFAGTQTKWAAEQALQNSGIPYTIFRAATFMESLSRYVRGNRAATIGKPTQSVPIVAANDYANMVVRSYETPAAANRIFYIHGPQRVTVTEALQTYCSIVHPGMKAGATPVWIVSTLAKLTRDRQLAAFVEFFRYSQNVSEGGDPSEANQLLGAPTTTLAQWCQQQVRSKH